MEYKGIILAGGKSSRLAPITNTFSKHLLPVYDKPMIYYPLSTLMLAGIREILIITTPADEYLFKKLLGSGEDWGIKISYEKQYEPKGLVDAFLIGKDFLSGSPVSLILGDNLFHGDNLIHLLNKLTSNNKGANVLACPVVDPERYCVAQFNKDGKVIDLTEKPKLPKSRFAITGIYFYDSTAIERALKVKPSERGELEITELNKMYLEDDLLNIEIMGRGIAWLDTGTCDSLQEASGYIHTLLNRQGLKVSCPEEISWRNGWINNEKLNELATKSLNSGYGDYLLKLLEG